MPVAVEDERGHHRAEELDERTVDVDDGDRPPAGPATLPRGVHELLGLDRVGPEVADLVAGAEVFLELAGDDTELLARPREAARGDRELDEGQEQDQPEHREHQRDHAGRQDHDRDERAR